MVPWGTGNPISSGDLNTLVFLTEKPPPLSVSIGGGSMSQSVIRVLKQRIRSDISHRSDIKTDLQSVIVFASRSACIPLI